MSPRLNRMWLLPLLLLAGQSWALGLGDIRITSALNQPLRAEIELLASTPEELNNLTIQLASVDTFARYDLDRPLFLTRIQFQIVRSGRADGNFIRVTSVNAISEPFITILVEAVWSRGRLLREYTMLLDPPTFAAPPVAQSSQEVTAPRRATPTDSGQIQRPAEPPPAAPAPAQSRPVVQAPARSAPAEPVQSTTPTAIGPEPTPTPSPTRAPPQDRGSFDTTPGGELVVVRGDTLWGITRRVRPDSRLTINQTMLAIFEANPDAFAGNINRLRAGAVLRIPSADDVFRITRTDAFAEVKRQNEAWGGLPGISTPAPAPAVAPEFVPEVAPVVDTAPNLTLVPPDDDVSLTDTSITSGTPDADADALPLDPDEARIQELEALFENQDSLIEIEDNELAALRAELARLRGEELVPVADVTLDDAVLADEDESLLPADALLGDDQVADDTKSVPAVVVAPARDEPGIGDVIMGYLGNFWVIIGLALTAAIALLVWFMRRAAKDDEDATGVWETIDVVDPDVDSQADTLAATSSLTAVSQPDDTTILVEEARAPRPADSPLGDTLAAPAAPEPDAPADPLAETGTNQSLEDTFSSETAINLDQTDPMAEADFHMAYGLYDQAADLINGALATEPEREELLAKLCEIYFVWGSRDAFVDAAGRMKAVAGDDANPEWDKIVIMGQQIAADHELFSGVSAGAATKAVDLSFEDGADETGALDLDLADAAAGDASDVIDLGAENIELPLPSADVDDIISEETGQVRIAAAGNDIDFSFDEPEVEASATLEMPDVAQSDETADTPVIEDAPVDDVADTAASDETTSSPTIEQQFDTFDATGELPVIKDADEAAPAADQTAEINLDDLGLDLDSLSDPSLAGELDDKDDTSISQVLETADDIAATGADIADLDKTGENPSVDVAMTGVHKTPDIELTGMQNVLPDLDEPEDTDVGIDTSLLDATGQTQVLSEDMIVRTGADLGASLDDDDKTMLAPSLSDDSAIEDLAADAATMLAPLDDDDDEGDFDFAKTEALPKDSFSADMSVDETGRMPGLTGGTDMDLDLDDLTAALKVSEVGDTVNQIRDDATVEQPRLKPDAIDLDVGMMVDDGGDGGTTQALAPDDLSGDLHDARTMTEVGTKLDLARAYVDMGDPSGARSILEEVLDEGDEGQRQQAQKLLGSLPG